MLAMLGVASLQMQVSPNLWVMINTLQVLRTILLLKINLPLGVRQTIEASSLFAQFDFGISNVALPEPHEPEHIIHIMNGDSVLAQYFGEYGIETYRFIDYVFAVFFDAVLLFILSSIGITLISIIYLKIKKKPIAPVKEKLKYVFLANGLIRLYMEILLDGLIYALINLRSLKFLGVMDAFSYLILSAFTCFVIFFSVFIVIYTKNTTIEKWSQKIRELLTETNQLKKGILAYHLIFIVRRVIIAINVILLGSFHPNVHISIHAVSQFIVLMLLSFYPMYESKF